jgi:hypothetical protein
MNDEKTYISVTHYGERYSAEFDSDTDIDGIIQKLRGLLVMCGFSQELVFDQMKISDEM